MSDEPNIRIENLTVKAADLAELLKRWERETPISLEAKRRADGSYDVTATFPIVEAQ